MPVVKGAPGVSVRHRLHVLNNMMATIPEAGDSAAATFGTPKQNRPEESCSSAVARVAEDPGLYRPYRKSGASTSVIVASSLIRTCSEGPAVSLKGSPTVSPTTAALCASERLPPYGRSR